MVLENINNVEGADYQQKIFFVDDEPLICKEMDTFLRDAGFNINCFTSPNDCLERLTHHECDLLITDYRLHGMNGIELMKKVHSMKPVLPTIIITGYGDIPTSVSTMKEGATDFLEKPLDLDCFLSKIRSILNDNCINNLRNISLSKMELTVLKLIMEGKNSKESAFILKRSRRTIENHQYRIMKKFRVNNVVDLTKRASLLRYG